MPKDVSKAPSPNIYGTVASAENDGGGRRGRGRGRGQGARLQPGRGRGGARRSEGGTSITEDYTVGGTELGETTPNDPGSVTTPNGQLEETGTENVRRGRGVGSQRGRGRGRGGRAVTLEGSCGLDGHVGEEEGVGGAVSDGTQRQALAPIPVPFNNDTDADGQELEEEDSVSQARLQEQIKEVNARLQQLKLDMVIYGDFVSLV